MTVTVLEPTVGLDVNLDAELVCHLDRCERSADVRLRYGCGCALLFCRPHLEEIRANWDEAEKRLGFEPTELRCMICHTTYAATPPRMFDQTTQVTPL